jgi:hypothetical protein
MPLSPERFGIASGCRDGDLDLAGLQARTRDAVVLGTAGGLAPLLAGGADPLARMAIHQRHYRASLVQALLRRYPALTWLVGAAVAEAAAAEFVRLHPPQAPCIAEYGEGFPRKLATRPDLTRRPYLADLGALEWRLGQAAVAVDRPVLGLDALAAVAPERLGDAVLGLQPGLFFLDASWPVDRLMEVFLKSERPGPIGLEAEPVGLEAESLKLQICGARGSVRFGRLTPGSMAFRAGVAGALPLADAAERALAAEPGFQAGPALVSLVAEGLVVSVTCPSGGSV